MRWASESERTNSYAHARRERSQDVWQEFGEKLEKGPSDWDRRNRCEFNFLAFCQTYGGEAFNLGWSSYHRLAAERIQEAALNGERFAFAMPRGSGKTTLSRWAVVWAVLYGHSPYSVLIGKTAASAENLLRSIKTSLRFNQLLFEDFPEAIAPVRHIKGEVRRCLGQKCQGEPTLIEWASAQIVFAEIPVPYAKCCGSIIDVCGIEGEIRGRQRELPDGRILRPTFAVVDDPQDRASAKSPATCDEREQTLRADVVYLAGPDRPTGVVVPCTVIYQDDLADRLLNRKRCPEWHGVKTRMVEHFPGHGLPRDEARKTERLWEQYRKTRDEDLAGGGNGATATEFYRQNQAAMDRGAVVSWKERYFKGELSAIQHAMNRKFEDEISFAAEYQNEPMRSDAGGIELPGPDELRVRSIGVPRLKVPEGLDKLTAFVDVSQKVLWWSVVGWNSQDFTGSVIAYGTWPEQRASYVSLATVKNTLEKAARRATREPCGFEGALAWGLEALGERLLGNEYQSESGGSLRVEQMLIDANWQASTEVVNAYCRRSKYAPFLKPSRGHAVTAPNDGLVNPAGKKKPGELKGVRCKVLPATNGGRWVLYDSSWWKSFVFRRLSVPVGDPGALTFHAEPAGHRMLIDQLTAETCERKDNRGFEYDKWSMIPSRPDNHFLDCLTGAAVAASLIGVSAPGIGAAMAKPRVRKRAKISF